MLDRDACYRAMASRDRRFEGRFVIGVTTTGIYCRPGCPARLPRREHVVFFPTTAAAAEAGLRPCKRCRPDASADSPAALGTPATVRRALRILREDGCAGGVEELASRLGIGSRHLRRLFDRHLGASPLAVAQTERAHFARHLVERTSLPMIDVAHAAGFASVRRFNEAMRRAYREPPSALRRRAHTEGARSSDVVTLRIPFRAPLDWDAMLAFIAPRAIPGVEHVERGRYSRTIAVGDAVGVVRVSRDDETHLVLEARVRGRIDLFALAGRVRRLFDLDADPRAITEHLGRDAALARRVRARPGLRVVGAWDPLETAVRIVAGQQVSVAAATTLTGRIVERFGARIEGSTDALSYVFPRREALAEATVEALPLPKPRAEAIRALARAAADPTLLRPTAESLDAIVARLTALPGIGPWTAHAIAMRACGEPDAFPSGDLGLRRALSDCGQPLANAALDARAEAWRPWRAYAAMHLWTTTEAPHEADRNDRARNPHRTRAARGG